MPRLKSISLQLRFLLLGLTLLSVLSLDKREVAIYVQEPASEQTFKAAKQLVIKEKVSFEALASYVVLPAAILPATLSFEFKAPVAAAKPFLYAVPAVMPLCRQLLLTAISPNAP